MNIGVDMRSLVAGVTGIARYTGCILDELQRIDHENNYCLFECRKSNYVPTNPKWEKISHNWKHVGTIWQQLVLPTLLKKRKIDVLWAPEQIGPVLWLPPDTKMVTTIHDFVIRRYPETCSGINLYIKRLLGAPTIRKSHALVPVSDHIKNELMEFFPELSSTSKIIQTVNNGAKNWSRANRPAERENFLFFPGSVEPRKNLNRLIKALEIVNASGFELDLHICGPVGWKNADFRKLIDSSPIKNRVTHLGYLSDADLLSQYLKCKALIYPSIYEGFGIPILEALNLDTPVLTSKGTVMEEIAGESAMYFDPYDVDSIAAVIIKFLKTGGVPVDHNGLKRYNWERSAKQLLEVFEETRKQG